MESPGGPPGLPVGRHHQGRGAKALAEKVGKHGDLVVYFALSPSLYGSVCTALQSAGLTGPKTRLVLEKPIGKDFASSCVINGAVGAVVDESRSSASTTIWARRRSRT